MMVYTTIPSDDTRVPTIATNKSLLTGGISTKLKNKSKETISTNIPDAPR
jgi:hypothetical protein